MDLAFVLLEEPVAPDPQLVIDTARQYGVELAIGKGKANVSTFEFAEGGSIYVAMMAAPHPDVPKMAFGPTSPDRDAALAAKAHYVITAMWKQEDHRIRDAMLARVVAAVVAASPAVGAMLGVGVLFHQAKLFTALAEGYAAGELPVEVCVDVTIAPEDDDRMSFLTHGMARYGREEFFVTASRTGQGAMSFVYTMVKWMLADTDKQLATGATVGRDADEK
ncbi:MAG: hypothetical protein HN348_08045, partial [Proteobacteria bacterium]|nr:hypothetical protein [Pseudomonadota bacterium]